MLKFAKLILETADAGLFIFLFLSDVIFLEAFDFGVFGTSKLSLNHLRAIDTLILSLLPFIGMIK